MPSEKVDYFGGRPSGYSDQPISEAMLDLIPFGPPPDSPEKKLYRAMVRDALNLVYSVSPRDGVERRRLKHDAVRWFRGDCISTEQCSFEEVCVNLELGDPGELAAVICKQLGEPPPTWERRRR